MSWSTLAEMYGTFTRPDASGLRGHGLGRPLYRRPDDFPYDRDSSYGEPAAYDRGSSGHGGSHAEPPVPKDTEHSVWDDIGEAMGTPMFLAKAYQGGTGASGMQAAGRGWAGNPTRPWDETDDEREDENFQDMDVVTPQGVPQPEPVPDASPPSKVSPSSDVFIVGSPKGFVTGLSGDNIRYFGDLMPKESIWNELVRRISPELGITSPHA